MNLRRLDLPLERLGRPFLPWTIAALVYSRSSRSGVAAVADGALHLYNLRAKLVTVTLPSVDDPGRVPSRSRRRSIVLHQTRGVTSATPVAPDELKKLVEPWLGSLKEASELPLPRLIDVTLDPKAKPDLPALAGQLQRIVTRGRRSGSKPCPAIAPSTHWRRSSGSGRAAHRARDPARRADRGRPDHPDQPPGAEPDRRTVAQHGRPRQLSRAPVRALRPAVRPARRPARLWSGGDHDRRAALQQPADGARRVDPAGPPPARLAAARLRTGDLRAAYHGDRPDDGHARAFAPCPEPRGQVRGPCQGGAPGFSSARDVRAGLVQRRRRGGRKPVSPGPALLLFNAALWLWTV